jgi:DNA-directed RNA polymerase
MQDDFERSRGRWLDQEEIRTRLTGFGTNRQGRAILRKYRKELVSRLRADRRQPHHKEIWRALRDAGLVGAEIVTARFTDILFIMGITAAAGDGVYENDSTNRLRDQAIWLGQHLGLKRSQRVLEFKVGAWAIDMLGGVSVFALDKDGVLTIPLTAELDGFLNAVVEAGIRNNAFIFPSAAPPEPWTQVSKGGLSSSNDWARVSLISSRHPKSENAVRKAIADGKMQLVLDAVNSLAQTAFRINKPIFDFMRRREEPRLQKLGSKLARWREMEAERKLKWPERQELANIRAELKVWALDTMVAKILADRERFFIPLQIDFRGRINPLPFFNFTRQDYVRSLFLFDHGEPIGEEGLRYLKAHVAACADGNKWSLIERPGNLDLDKRIAWTDANLPLLRKIGNAVLRGEDDPAQWEWVLQPDMADTLVTFAKPNANIVEISCNDPKREGISDPYAFLAACVELAQALEVGPSFKTRLPLVFDATCSGLQHICAMMRAEEGRLVNLVPSNELRDFYSLVGVAVYKKRPELRHFFKDSNPFDRKIIKRPGMTYGYGSRPGGWKKTKRAGRPKPKGMTEQIVEILKERGQSTKDAHKLAKAAYDVIEELMPAAKTLRNSLEKIAKVYTKCNKTMRWETPLPALNGYYEALEPQTISVKIGGKRHQTSIIPGDTDDISDDAWRKITANFIHSVDAAHLHLVALACAAEGIPLVTIHDCFGPTAPHAKRLNEIVRQQFVQLHENYNWLEQVLASAKRDLPKSVHHKLPELPKRGNLSLAGVLQSFFAFK